MDRKLRWRFGATSVLGLPLFVLCFFFGSTPQDKCLNVMVLLAGLLIGWILGVLISPYDILEREDFSQYTRAVAAFASGYLVAKIDPLVNTIFSPTFFANPVAAFRFTLLFVAALSSLIITFYYRRYTAWEWPPEARKQDQLIRKTTRGKLRLGMTKEDATSKLEGYESARIIQGPERTSTLTIEQGDYRLHFRYGLLEDVEELNDGSSGA